MKYKNQISVRDQQLLSAYIDGELSPKHKKYISGLLAENPNALKTIEKIKKVKTLLKYLPARKVPRNFTISAQETERFQLPSLTGVFRYSTAVSAVLLAIVLALDFFSPFQTPTTQLSEDNQAEKSAIVEETRMEMDASVPIITWHPSSPSTAEGFGIGGGDDGGLGSGGMQPEPLIPSSIIPPQENFSDKIPDSVQENPIVEDEQLPQVAEGQPMAESEASALELLPPDYGNGPILGVRPADEQGTIQTGIESPQVKGMDAHVFSYLHTEILLATLAVISALLTHFLRKNKK